MNWLNKGISFDPKTFKATVVQHSPTYTIHWCQRSIEYSGYQSTAMANIMEATKLQTEANPSHQPKTLIHPFLLTVSLHYLEDIMGFL